MPFSRNRYRIVFIGGPALKGFVGLNMSAKKFLITKCRVMALDRDDWQKLGGVRAFWWSDRGHVLVGF